MQFGHFSTVCVVISDNGPQFRTEFAAFAEDWKFRHVTSSPRHAQANGFAEAMVKVAKQKLEKATDPYKALLAYRTSPLSNGWGSAQLLFSRQLRTTLPLSPDQLKQCIPYRASLQRAEELAKEHQAMYYNRRHAVRPLPPLEPRQRVWITGLCCRGTVLNEADTPRSYWVRTQTGIIRRNRRFLVQDRGSTASGNSLASMHDLPSLRQEHTSTGRETTSRPSSSSDGQYPRMFQGWLSG